MTKENFLFSIIGLLLGTIIGFFVANSINTGAAMQAGPAAQAAIPGQPSGAMPAGHPAIPGADGQSVPEVQAAIESARKEPKNFEAQMKAAEVFYQIQRFEGAIDARPTHPGNTDTVLGHWYLVVLGVVFGVTVLLAVPIGGPSGPAPS